MPIIDFESKRLLAEAELTAHEVAKQLSYPGLSRARLVMRLYGGEAWRPRERQALHGFLKGLIKKRMEKQRVIKKRMKKQRVVFQFRASEVFMLELVEAAKRAGMATSVFVRNAVRHEIQKDKRLDRQVKADA